MQPIINYIKSPARLLDSIVHNYCRWLPDKLYIKLRYRFQMGKRVNLKCPITFQEKIQWLKLFDRNPKYTIMVDKIKVKEFVASKIGSRYVIPLLGIWDKPENIQWDMLPDKFVLKTNHSGGNTGVIICRDKNVFDKESAIAKLNKSLHNDVYLELREWPYKNIEKKVFAERLIEVTADEKDLADYKWYCFDGEPKFCQVIQNRNTKETIDFFDTNWEHMEFVGLNPSVANAEVPPIRPSSLETHIHIAKELSRGTPFSRIDLYETRENTYFGEITFFPASGIGRFKPDKYDIILGNLINLPNKK